MNSSRLDATLQEALARLVSMAGVGGLSTPHLEGNGLGPPPPIAAFQAGGGGCALDAPHAFVPGAAGGTANALFRSEPFSAHASQALPPTGAFGAHAGAAHATSAGGRDLQHMIDWHHFNIAVRATPPMPARFAEALHDVTALLDARADMAPVRDGLAEELLRDTLNHLVGAVAGGGTSSPGSLLPVSSAAPGSVTPLPPLQPLPSSGAFPSMPSSMPAAAGDGRPGRVSSPEPAGCGGLEVWVHPVDASVHLCNAIFDIQYADSASRHTRLCRHLIHVMTTSVTDHHTRFAASVYSKILHTVRTASEATALKRQAHAGQGRLAQAYADVATADSSDSKLLDGRYPSPTVSTFESLAKEVRDLTEAALRQLQGRKQHRPQAHALGLLMLIHITFPFLPENAAVFAPELRFRANALALAALWMGCAEPMVRFAAYDCLETVLQCRVSRQADALAETQSLFAECQTGLRQGSAQEHVIVGAALELRALLSVRGSKDIDRGAMSGVCSAVVDLHKNTRLATVRQTLACLIPVLVRADPQLQTRRAIYLAATIEPLKNIRDMASKPQELLNLRVLLASVGSYATLDASTRVNIESVLMSLLSKAVVPGTTQGEADGRHQHGSHHGGHASGSHHLSLPMACWSVIAAIFQNGAPDAFASTVDKCIPTIPSSVLTSGMLGVLSAMRGCAPNALALRFDAALEQRAEQVLRRTAAAIALVNASASAAPAKQPSPLDKSTAPNTKTTPTSTGPRSFIANLFMGRDSASGDAQQDGYRAVVGGVTSAGIRPSEAALHELSQPTHVDEATCALEIFSRRLVRKAATESQQQAAVAYWRRTEEVMLPLQSHPVALVRTHCARIVGFMLRNAIAVNQTGVPLIDPLNIPTAPTGGSPTGTVAALPAAPVVALYCRAALVPFVDDYLRRITFELDTRVKAVMLHAMSGGSPGMLIPGRTPPGSGLPSELTCDRVMDRLGSLLQGTKRVREAALELLLCIRSASGPSSRAQSLLSRVTAMHVKGIAHIEDPLQISGSCAIIALIIKTRPSLLTTETLSQVMHAVCSKLWRQYGERSRVLMATPSANGAGGTSTAGGLTVPIAQIFDSRARYRAAVCEGEVREEGGRLGGGGSRTRGSTMVSSPVQRSPVTPAPPAANPSTAGGAQRINPNALHGAALTILLLSLLNQLLIAGKTLQRQKTQHQHRLSSGDISGMAPTGSPTGRGPLRAFGTGQRPRSPQAPTPPANSSPILIVTESEETRRSLETLWTCLLEASRTIASMHSLQQAATKAARARQHRHHSQHAHTGRPGGKHSDKGRHGSVYSRDASATGGFEGTHGPAAGSFAFPSTAAPDARLIAVLIDNASTIQHQALCALTDLLTLSPQNILDFAHKTALIEYLRSEYLRSCGSAAQLPAGAHPSAGPAHDQAGGAAPGTVNRIAAFAGASKNDRHRLSIIRLFGLLGAVDPARGEFSQSTADAASIVVEGDAGDKRSQHRQPRGEPGQGAVGGAGAGAGGPMIGGAGAPQANDGAATVHKMSARARAMILKNAPDTKKDVYPFARDTNYAVTLYRVIVRLLEDPADVAERALLTALRLSLHLMRDPQNSEIQGWNLIEAVMEIVRAGTTADEVQLLALTTLPELIRCRRTTAGQLVREFFATVIFCWNPSNAATFVPLLSIVDELHRVNPEASEALSSCCGSVDSLHQQQQLTSNGSMAGPGPSNVPPSSLPLSFTIAGHSVEEVDEAASGASLYLKLVDVALNDVSESRDVSFKIVSILGHMERQHLIAPVVVSSFLNFVNTRADSPIALRLECVRMISTLVCRFHIYSAVTTLLTTIGALQQCLCEQPGVALSSASALGDAVVLLRSRFSLADTTALALADRISAVTQQWALSSAGSDKNPSTAADEATETSSATAMTPSMLMACPTEGPNLDVLVLHINRALSDGVRRGAAFEWGSWFYDFQRHVLLQSPHPAFRLSFELFNLHEPLRKTIFYPAFHALLTAVLKTQISAKPSGAAKAGHKDPSAPTDVSAVVGRPLRKALALLLRFGDSESVDMCLGLHDYLEHFRSPNVRDDSASALIGAYFAVGTPHKYGERDDDEELFGVPVDQPAKDGSKAGPGALHRTTCVQSLAGAASLPNNPTAVLDARSSKLLQTASGQLAPLLSGGATGGGDSRPVVQGIGDVDEDDEFLHLVSRRDSRKMSPLERTDGDATRDADRRPWTLFRTVDLIRASIEHRLHYKAVRYLEQQYPRAVAAALRRLRSEPGVGMALLASDQVSPAGVVGAAAALQKETLIPTAAACAVVNFLAQQYSRVGMQQSVAGLFTSVRIGIDATGFELLQRWPEANKAYRRRIAACRPPRPLNGDAALLDQQSGAPLQSIDMELMSPVTQSLATETRFDDTTADELVDLSDAPPGQTLNSFNSTTLMPLNLMSTPSASGFASPMDTTVSPPVAEHLAPPGTGGPQAPQQALSAGPQPQQQGQQVLRIKDVEGYMRTRCFCGAWSEGLRFAKAYSSVLRDAAAIHQPTRQRSASVPGLGDGTASSAQQLRSRGTAADTQLPQQRKRGAAVVDSALTCATLCAIVMQQWEDVGAFAECLQDRTDRLLFRQLTMAHAEMAVAASAASSCEDFSTALRRSSTYLHGEAGPHAVGTGSTLVLDLERNLARALVTIDEQLRTALALSYTHAYDVVTRLQHFQEIEEARMYRRSDSTHTLRRNIKNMWLQRFQSMKPDAISMLKSVVIYSLAAPPRDLPEIMYHFSKAVRRTHPQLGTWAMSVLQNDCFQLNGLGGSGVLAVGPATSIGGRKDSDAGFFDSCSSPLMPNPASLSLVSPAHRQQRGDVQVDYCEYLWSIGEHDRAVEGLTTFLTAPETVSCNFGLLSSPSELVEQTGLQHVGRAHLLLGLWRQDASDTFWRLGARDDILHNLFESVQAVPQEYSTWHAWALMNYRVQQRDVHLTPPERTRYIERAHRGFVAAICRSDRPKAVMQDVMRLLQLWIIYGGAELLAEGVIDAIHRIAASLWCECSPQVLAHLGNEQPRVWACIRAIIEKACLSYPQMFVFPLLVPILSDPEGVGRRLRPSRAQMLLNIACPDELSQEARKVATGLVELAMFPVERIRDAIGSALKIMRSIEPPISDAERSAILVHITAAHKDSDEHKAALSKVGDVAGVIAALAQKLRHDHSFGEAVAYCNQLYAELQEHVKEMKRIDLRRDRVSLVALRSLKVWVPGEYSPSSVQPPSIFGFVDRVEVIESKRRPRRLHVIGTDGNINTYCLKGNEDVRVDARAMQLFGLVNAFAPEGAVINRFPVVPLSETAGLLGWVQESETLYSIIRSFRARARLPVDAELDVLSKEFGPVNDARFHKLTGMQKAELFEHMFASCESDDMAHVLWYRSVNAELWLKRRTRFTTALASMSTAGYILGLGDRHPGNLLVQMSSGAVVHIDFGDCFDVARLRTSFPETVPFRLTPMLVNAMEVFGVSGAFQATCEASLGAMRTNRDSIVALLSSFVYDPVMDRRLAQQRRGSLQGIIESVRRKLRGIEMPAAHYPHGHEAVSWPAPIIFDGPDVAATALMPTTTTTAAAAGVTTTAATPAQQQSTAPAGSPTRRQAAPFTPPMAPALHQHTMDMDDAFEDLTGPADTVAPQSVRAAKREAAVRGEDLSTWHLPPRADLAFIVSQAASERAMRQAGAAREPLSVKQQVQVLIREATSHHNLSEVFPGWTPWW